MAALAVCLAGACTNGDGSLAGPTESASPSPSVSGASPSAGPSGVSPAVTAAYSALSASLGGLAKDLPAMAGTADFRPDLAAMNAALARARNGLSAERAARYPSPDCSRVRADAAVVRAASADALGARGRIAARATAVAAASQRVEADRALVAAKAAALSAALKATGSVLPPSLSVPDVSGTLTNAKSAQAQVATTTASAQSAGAAGAADAASLRSKADQIASVC